MSGHAEARALGHWNLGTFVTTSSSSPRVHVQTHHSTVTEPLPGELQARRRAGAEAEGGAVTGQGHPANEQCGNSGGWKPGFYGIPGPLGLAKAS